jgi:hypothetical protein
MKTKTRMMKKLTVRSRTETGLNIPFGGKEGEIKAQGEEKVSKPVTLDVLKILIKIHEGRRSNNKRGRK